MRKLSGGQIDLADGYNQILLSPDAVSFCPFSIISTPGYVQEIIDKLTQDLPGISVYIDDILIGGVSPEDHWSNVQKLFQRLKEKGLRCPLEKCVFAQPSVEYLGFNLSKE